LYKKDCYGGRIWEEYFRVCSLVNIDLKEMKMMNLDGLDNEVCIVHFKEI